MSSGIIAQQICQKRRKSVVSETQMRPPSTSKSASHVRVKNSLTPQLTTRLTDQRETTSDSSYDDLTKVAEKQPTKRAPRRQQSKRLLVRQTSKGTHSDMSTVTNNNNRTQSPQKGSTVKPDGINNVQSSNNGFHSNTVNASAVDEADAILQHNDSINESLLDKSFATSISLGGQTQQSNGEMSDASAKSNVSSSEIMAKGLEPRCKFYGRVSTDKRTCLLRDCCITERGDVCITDANNSNIKVFSLEGEHIRTISHPSLKEPFGISSLGENKLIVADRRGKDLKIFTIDGQFVETVGHNLQEYPMKEPRGIAVDSEENIVVTDATRRCVYIYPLQGAFCDIIWGEAGLKPLQFKNPAYVTVTPEDDIVVSDYFGNKIAVFNAKTHDLKFTYGNKPGDKKLRYPRGVTTDVAGNIIVADNYNGKVHAVSSDDGQFIRYVYGDKHGIHRPRSVACDNRGNIVVIESGSRIRIFSITEPLYFSETPSEEGGD